MCVCESYDFEYINLTSTPLQEFYLYYLGNVTFTWVLSTYLRSDSSVPDIELVLYLLQDKLTSRDKSLDLSAFKLFAHSSVSCLQGLLVVGDSMGLTFQGRPSSAPSGSVTPTLALTDIQANVEGENATTTATEEPPSHTEGENEEPRLAIPISSIPSTITSPTQPITSIIIHPESSQKTPKIVKGKRIATEYDDDFSKKLVKASSIVCPDPDKPVRVKFIINGGTIYLTEQEI
nr:hypothetical protein [Tanacetum cinerariifolium]